MRWVCCRWPLAASGAVFAALAVAALWGGGAPWRGEWQWTFDNVNGATVLLGPAAAAVAAWTVQDVGRHPDLLHSTVRGCLLPAVQAAVVWCWVVLAWSCAAVSGVVGTASVVHGGPTPVWVLVAGPAVLGAYVSIGGAVGAAMTHRVAAIAVAPFAFVLAGVASGAGAPNLLRQGPGTSSLAGLAWEPRTFLMEMVALTALTGACLAVVVTRSAPWSFGLKALASLTSVAFLGSLAALEALGDTRFVPSDEASSRCVSGQVVVCVAPSNARSLDDLVAGFNALVPRIRAAGLGVPPVFRELLPNSAGGHPWAVIQLGSHANAPHPGAALVAEALSTPRDCPAFSDPAVVPPEDMFEARSQLAHWFLRGAPVATAAFRQWAVVTYDRLSACQLAAVHPYGRRRAGAG